MPTYEYTGNTKQSGVNHTNFVVALKVDVAGTPVFEILDEQQADASGDFTLSWDDYAGRVLVIAADDDAASALQCKACDFITGTVI